MKSILLLKALDYADEELVADALEEPAVTPKRRFWKPIIAVAVSFLLLVSGGFSVWLFVPAANTEDFSLFHQDADGDVLRMTCCRIDDRLAIYYFEDEMSRFDEWRLERRLGEVYRVHGGGTFYRVQGEEGLEYLIYQKHGSSELDLLKFDSMFVFDDMESAQNSGWCESGILSQADLNQLRFEEMPTFAEVFEKIYGMDSATDIKKVKFAYKFGDDDRTVTVKDSSEIENLYHIIYALKRTNAEETIAIAGAFFHDDVAYQNGTVYQREKNAQAVTVYLKAGTKIEFTYSPFDGVWYQGNEVFYKPLSDNDNAYLMGLLGID